MVETAVVEVSSGTAGRWWRSPLWRKAPVALLHHRSALAAVAAAAFLVALAASSAPLLTTAAASAALRDELRDLSPLATGLEITGLGESTRPVDAPRPLRRPARAGDRGRSARACSSSRRSSPSSRRSRSLCRRETGDVPVRLLARTGVLDHVRIVRRTDGRGVWVSDLTARIAHLEPGGILRLSFAAQGGVSRTIAAAGEGDLPGARLHDPRPLLGSFPARDLPAGGGPASPRAVRPARPRRALPRRPRAPHLTDRGPHRLGASARAQSPSSPSTRTESPCPAPARSRAGSRGSGKSSAAPPSGRHSTAPARARFSLPGSTGLRAARSRARSRPPSRSPTGMRARSRRS